MLMYVLLALSLLANVACMAIIASLEKQLDDLSDKLFYAQEPLYPIECDPWEVEDYEEQGE